MWLARQLPGTAVAQGGPLQFRKLQNPSLAVNVNACKVAQVKSAVRCSMTDDRLEHLVLVKGEQDITGSLDLASLVDIFKMQGSSDERRVKL